MPNEDAALFLQPDVDLKEICRVIEYAHSSLLNVRSHAPAVQGGHYLSWATEVVRLMRFTLDPADIDRLVLTQRHWAIAAAPEKTPMQLLNAELDDRAHVLKRTLEWLDDIRGLWNGKPGRLVVADTSVFCQHEDKLADLDLARLLECRDTPVRLVLPILVLDELEGLKQSSKNKIRWRAAHTLGLLHEVLGSDGIGLLREEDFTPLSNGGSPRGAVYAHILFDPLRHHRLPINDDELVARALAVQTQAGRSVTFLTFDTAQSTRARFAGLQVLKLSQPLGPEPVEAGAS